MCKGLEKGSCCLFQDICPSIRWRDILFLAYFISQIIQCQLIGLLNNELERTWRAVICVMYYTSICLNGLKKATKNLSQDSRSPDRDLNPEPVEYKVEVGLLLTRLRGSKILLGYCSYTFLSNNFECIRCRLIHLLLFHGNVHKQTPGKGKAIPITGRGGP
jgi:hypothetical protein